MFRAGLLLIMRRHYSRRGQLKCDGTRAETRFRLSAKRTSTFKSAGASVQSTTGSRGMRISGSNSGYTVFRGSVKGTGYPLHSPVSPSLPLPCVTMCHHISTGFYYSVYTAIDMCHAFMLTDCWQDPANKLKVNSVFCWFLFYGYLIQNFTHCQLIVVWNS